MIKEFIALKDDSFVEEVLEKYTGLFGLEIRKIYMITIIKRKIESLIRRNE